LNFHIFRQDCLLFIAYSTPIVVVVKKKIEKLAAVPYIQGAYNKNSRRSE